MKETVLTKAMEVWKRHDFAPLADLAIRGTHLFLPVITEQRLNYDQLMQLVRHKGSGGMSCLGMNGMNSCVPNVHGLYYIYDVEDGSATKGKTPKEVEQIFASQKRSPLTIPEVINLCALTNTLSRHNVFATGSRYGSADKVPGVFLANGSDRPKLYWNRVDYSFDRWGSASCLR